MHATSLLALSTLITPRHQRAPDPFLLRPLETQLRTCTSVNAPIMCLCNGEVLHDDGDGTAAAVKYRARAVNLARINKLVSMTGSSSCSCSRGPVMTHQPTPGLLTAVVHAPPVMCVVAGAVCAQLAKHIVIWGDAWSVHNAVLLIVTS